MNMKQHYVDKSHVMNLFNLLVSSSTIVYCDMIVHVGCNC